MVDNEPGAGSNPKGVLTTTRIVWAAMLVGQVVFLVIVLVILSRRSGGGGSQASPDMTKILGYLVIAMLLGATAIGYFIRSQVYKANWQGDAVTPHGYARGNIILLAMLEGVAFFGLIVTIVHGSCGLAFAAAAIAMAIQVVNFPHGRPMYASDTPGHGVNRDER